MEGANDIRDETMRAGSRPGSHLGSPGSPTSSRTLSRDIDRCTRLARTGRTSKMILSVKGDSLDKIQQIYRIYGYLDLEQSSAANNKHNKKKKLPVSRILPPKSAPLTANNWHNQARQQLNRINTVESRTELEKKCAEASEKYLDFITQKWAEGVALAAPSLQSGWSSSAAVSRNLTSAPTSSNPWIDSHVVAANSSNNASRTGTALTVIDQHVPRARTADAVMSRSSRSLAAGVNGVTVVTNEPVGDANNSSSSAAPIEQDLEDGLRLNDEEEAIDWSEVPSTAAAALTSTATASAAAAVQSATGLGFTETHDQQDDEDSSRVHENSQARAATTFEEQEVNTGVSGDERESDGTKVVPTNGRETLKATTTRAITTEEEGHSKDPAMTGSRRYTGMGSKTSTGSVRRHHDQTSSQQGQLPKIYSMSPIAGRSPTSAISSSSVAKGLSLFSSYLGSMEEEDDAVHQKYLIRATSALSRGAYTQPLLTIQPLRCRYEGCHKKFSIACELQIHENRCHRLRLGASPPKKTLPMLRLSP